MENETRINSIDPEEFERLVEENDKFILEGTYNKRGAGRIPGFHLSEEHKQKLTNGVKEYQRKLKEGHFEWRREDAPNRGAYEFINSTKIQYKKRRILKFVRGEREKWLRDLGGVENLNSIEISMLDEACRILLFASIINSYILSGKEEDIIFRDDDTGEVKMSSALSRNYLTFSKNYISILKELQKITETRRSKSSNNKNNTALKLQTLYQGEDDDN